MAATSMERRSAGAAGGQRPPRPQIGLWMATALVVGNMVGSGVFLLPASMAGEADPISVVAKGFMLLTLGVPVFVWLKWRQSRELTAPIPATSNGAAPVERTEPRVTMGAR